jgi:hypothetical protein
MGKEDEIAETIRKAREVAMNGLKNAKANKDQQGKGGKK